MNALSYHKSIASVLRIQLLWPVVGVLIIVKASLLDAAPIENKTGPLSEFLEHSLKGITNRVLAQILSDKAEVKYVFLLTANSGEDKATNSTLLYMPWRILQAVDTNDHYRLLAFGSNIEATISMADGNPKGNYGMPGSGFPRGSTNWNSSFDVQLWANKEVGDCEHIFHIHSENGSTNFAVLISKTDGKWIILESDIISHYTGYLARGNRSRSFGLNDEAATKQAAAKPLVSDDPSKFEDFYGKTKAIKTAVGETRLWRKGDFIITHIDGRPERLVVAVEKVSRADFNQGEVFEIAERFCQKQEWSLEEKSEKWSLYNSKDRKFRLTWSYRNYQDVRPGDDPRERVTLQFYTVSKGIKDL